MLKRLMPVLAIPLLASFACEKAGLGPQPKKQEGPPKANTALYEYDPTKPEGPVLQMLRAAQERDEELFRSAFSPEMKADLIEKQGFGKFRQKVLKGKLTPIPDATQQVSDTEAIVKLRGKGREIPITVKKYGDKWLVASIEMGARATERIKKKEEKAGAPAK